MPQVLTQAISSGKVPESFNDHIRNQFAPVTHRGRSIFFFVGDLMFLASAGMATTLTMHLVHQLRWPFVPTCFVGMVAAMLVQTLMAFAAAPLFGSIESMVPSMIVAMMSPMTICVLHLFGCESTWPMAAAIGSVFALGMFVFIQAYGLAYRKTLMTNRTLSGG
ncbi:MAG: hypothetical protein HY287_03745 [Planctomycetes bacterium]|nr:hypothetical protein [Planctomycetota bacterium]MBI3833425.1 hypothetical protein [Planctomycetota bacterium]